MGDRLLITWDVHGVLEDFCRALKMDLPTGDNAYVTAKGQFDWIKGELSVPELTYNDLMRLVETWIMGVPGEEVCAMSCVGSLACSATMLAAEQKPLSPECIFMSKPGDHQYRVVFFCIGHDVTVF